MQPLRVIAPVIATGHSEEFVHNHLKGLQCLL